MCKEQWKCSFIGLETIVYVTPGMVVLCRGQGVQHTILYGLIVVQVKKNLQFREGI